MKLSVIIVDYNNPQGLKKCLASIPTHDWLEVIVVDNTVENRGFAGGCNLGAVEAKGELLFFLNPDCELRFGAIQALIDRLESSDDIGIVAPRLLNANGNAYLNYTKQASYWCAFVVYSFLDSWWSYNPCSKSYWYEEDSLDEGKYVESVSGAALMIRKRDFEIVGGFNGEMFMYWEDYELCYKILEIGKKIFFDPKAEIKHIVGGSTPKNDRQVRTWFVDSRKKYFAIRFGKNKALLLESFLRICEFFSKSTKRKNLVRQS